MNCNGDHVDYVVERATRAVLVVDVVESVRLIEQDEEDTISRWLDLVHQIEKDLLPANKGHLVKSLGDGLLLEFTDARTAVLAAFAIQQASDRGNVGKPPDRRILLRIGIEVGKVIIEDHDVFGRGVNLAARLASLAGPGEIVVSASVREQITPDLDADVEDLGECFLKHVKAPVHAYRIGPPGASPLPRLPTTIGNMLPTLAVIPFKGLAVSKEHRILGEILAEETIRSFSRYPDLNVISRLSTTAFRGRVVSLAEIREHLNANYVLSGVYRADDDQIVLETELADAKSSQVAWSKRIKGQIRDIITGEQETVAQLVAEVRSAVALRELKHAKLQTLPTLDSYSLLMGAIALMHGRSKDDFRRAYKLLEALIERAPRQAIPQAWLAKWHVLQVQQGWASDPKQTAQRALARARRALDADPHSSLALAIDGMVHTNLLKRLDIAEERYGLAVEANPNDSLAWLLKGTMHAFKGEGVPAVEGTQHALSLSPLDPMRYFYDSLAATALNAAGEFKHALEIAKRSLRANRSHSSTLRTIAIAEWQLGRKDQARQAVQELLRLEPSLTVSGFLERSPAADYETGRDWSAVLEKAGLPK